MRPEGRRSEERKEEIEERKEDEETENPMMYGTRRIAMAKCGGCNGKGWVTCYYCKGSGKNPIRYDDAYADQCNVCLSGTVRMREAFSPGVGKLYCKGCRGSGDSEMPGGHWPK